MELSPSNHHYPKQRMSSNIQSSFKNIEQEYLRTKDIWITNAAWFTIRFDLS